MKTLLKLCALAAAVAAVSFGTFEARAQTPVPPKFVSFGGTPSFVASNMTTNVTCGGIPLYRERGLALINVCKTVTNQPTTQVVSFELSTNKPNDTVTNWFRPVPPVTATFTNNSGITTNAEVVILAASNFDNMAQIRPWSFQNTASTNGWTNVLFGAAITP